MKQLESVQSALRLFPGAYINYNNEIILIPKFNVYTLLNDVENDTDFKIKLCERFSRECSCALRYRTVNRIKKYWEENTKLFNVICGTEFTVEEMNTIYENLGNGINRSLSKKFVDNDFDLNVLITQEAM